MAVLAYGAMLFAIAYGIERKGMPRRLAPHGYALSLAVYCSSWTFFGGVGTASTNGWNYASIYLGPILVFLLAPRFLARMVALSRGAGSTSIADFISARYERSRSIAAIVAGIALVASIPYIAIQLRSVSSSFGTLVGLDRSWLLGPTVALLLATFAISFGARRYDVAGRNEGVVAAIAAESLIKLLSFVALGMFALLLFFGAPDTTRVAGVAAFEQRFHLRGLSFEFLVQLALSAMAIVCLPRQFYVGVIEASGPDPIRAARWPFIFYLATITVMVLPLALAGLTLLPASVKPDLHVLALPLSRGNDLVALLAFLGGFSAATAMVIVESIALSTMATNDLLAPLILRRGPAGGEADLGRRMMRARRVIIAAIIGTAFLYSEASDATRSLASIGLIAFAGMAQFAPALVATVAFDFGDARAVRAGLLGGLVLWVYCLLLPSLGDGRIAVALAQTSGAWLDPRALLRVDFGSPLVNGALCSLGANIGLLLLVHLLPRRMSPRGRAAAGFGHVTTVGELRALVARFVGEAEAADAFVTVQIGPNKPGDPDAPIDGHAARIAERLIASVIGAPSARLIVTSTMAGSAMEVGDVVRLLDESGHSLQFSRALLSATLETIEPGVSVIDRNLRLVAWNPQYTEMFDYPEGYVAVGRPIADLIRYNAERGECGPGEIDAHVERRLHHLRRGLPHSFERLRPSGHWIKTVGRPMPGGGYVMSFNDISAEKETQVELEARVETRTHALAASNEALAEAKSAAEAATRDKTRFLAAASHDLLQPLHAARLFCTAFGDSVEGEQLALARNIDRAIGSAESLLRSLLDVSRLDAGGITPKPERFALAGLIDELAGEFAPLAAERGLTLHAHAGAFQVETDRALLRSILQNFLSNAVRYTPSGRLWFGARRRGGQVRIEVRDSGPGIYEADQARIFQEFIRLESPGSAGAGVGLGLAIVERTARLLDLPLLLSSRPGAGSTFAVLVPLACGETVVPEPPRDVVPEKAAAVGGLRVLCLDNDVDILAAAEAALSSRGCVALLAGSADQAMALARSASPGAALLDLHLGEDRDGMDVAVGLREMGALWPIALVTADRAVAGDPRLAELNVTILPKPLDPERLWQFLATAAPLSLAAE